MDFLKKRYEDARTQYVQNLTEERGRLQAQIDDIDAELADLGMKQKSRARRPAGEADAMLARELTPGVWMTIGEIRAATGAANNEIGNAARRGVLMRREAADHERTHANQKWVYALAQQEAAE